MLESTQPMILNASNIYDLYRPSACELRVFLRHADQPQAEPGPFELLLRELGQRHERDHLTTLGPCEDVSEGNFGERQAKTRRLVGAGAAAIYQPVLMARAPEGFGDHLIIGIPDLLLREGNGYVVRDCKLARHVDERRHPEILRQVELYGWLYESTFRERPLRLEVLLGDGTVAALPPGNGGKALEALAEVRDVASLAEEPYSPVGWTKCQGCGFNSTCWNRATAAQDVATIYGVDQALARVLRDEGASSVPQLLERYDATSLAEVKVPRGARQVRVGGKAAGIIMHARAIISGQEERHGSLKLPDARNLVMFDLEGLPPYLDELDKVYLWGLQVFGDAPSGYMPALAGFGVDGDREGWRHFLRAGKGIFEQHGDIPFVHWHHYEKSKLSQYVGRYGDRDGIAERIHANLVDLLPITRKGLALPDPSYSLKVVESRAGFKRTMDEYGGAWSIAQYIRAVETEDLDLRNEVMSQILKYNEEDLAATWAVFVWLRSLAQQPVTANDPR